MAAFADAPPHEMAARQSEADRPEELDEPSLRQILLAYLQEGRQGRRGGFEDRDRIWERNADAYWGRYDFSRKAAWQSREVLPHVQNAVERFGSAMRRALKKAGQFYKVIDPQDRGGELEPMLQAFEDYWLERSGTNPSPSARP
jgi:hypothetical protein